MEIRHDLLPMRLRLCRGFTVAALSPTEVQIRSGLLSGQGLSLPDPSGQGELARLLAAMDGSQSTADLLAPWPEQSRLGLLQLIGRLVDRGLLLPGAGDPLQESLSPYKLAQEQRRRVSGADLTLVGAGVLGSRLAVSLTLAGLGRLTLWDPAALSESDRALSPAYAGARPGANRAEALAQYLAGLPGGGKAEVESDLAAAIAGRSLVLLAQDYAMPALCDEVNSLALRYRTPWSSLLVDGTQGLIGPTIYPGETACYRCLEGYWLQRSQKPEQLAALLTAMRTGDQPRCYHGPVAFAETVAGLFAAALPTLLAGGAGPTLGQVLAIELTSLSAMTYAVPRLPRCPACGAPSGATS